MRVLIFAILLSFRGFIASASSYTAESSEKENLSKAIEYFQGGKYHEALLLFQKLKSTYQLNVRFLAYMGVCHFYDRDYAMAAGILDSIMSRLGAFAPSERSIYYHCAAESHYQLGQYGQAIQLFEAQSLLCHKDEIGDICLRIGLCHRNLGHVDVAQEYLLQAMAYYRKFNNSHKLSVVDTEVSHSSLK